MSYELIETVEVGAGGAASIEFTDIPQDGTDLVLVHATRTTSTGTGGNTVFLQLNNDTASNYSYIRLYGDGSAPGSDSATTTAIRAGDGNASNSTTNTFSNAAVYISNYTSSASKSLSLDTVREANATAAWLTLVAARWSGTSAVSSLKMYPDGQSFVAGSTASLYKVSNVDASGATPEVVVPKASGGTIELSGGFWYHTFTSDDNFTPSEDLDVNYAIIAGGGGGGAGDNNSSGGGGGAGGVITTVSGLTNIPAQSLQSVTSGVNYFCTVGSGGSTNTNGSNSNVFGKSAIGGGYGGANSNGASGGSGGGGGSSAASSSSRSGGSGTTDQGTGGGSSPGGFYAIGGGGGGASQAGQNGTTSSGGDGGDGVNLGLPVATNVAGGGRGGGDDVNNYPNGASGSGQSGYGGGGAGTERGRGGASAGRDGAVIIWYAA